MAQTIQLRRRLGSPGVPGTLNPGEPAYNDPDGTANGSLYIGTIGNAVRTLISAARQIEMTGQQSITGTANAKTFDTDSLRITGGGASDLLGTDGSGNLDWISLADLGGITSVTATAPLSPATGGGITGTPLTLSYAAPLTVTANALALTVHSAGTDITGATPSATIPVTPSAVRAVLGDLSALDTTTTGTLVDAINEVVTNVTNVTTTVTNITTTPGNAAVLASLPLTGTGITGNPLALALQIDTSLLGAGLAANQLRVNVADAAAITAATALRPVDAAGLRTVTGDLTALTAGITQTNLVLAINSVAATVAGLDLGVTTNASLTGDGTSGTPLGVVFADAPTIEAGTLATSAVSPAGLRSQLGLPLTGLTTTVQTGIVQAINSVVTQITALQQAIRFVGTYDVPGNAVTPAAGGPATPGVLPPAAPANTGWMVLASVAGTGIGAAPGVSIAVSDMLISNGAAWVHMPLGLGTFAASNVVIDAITGITGGTVQLALGSLIGTINALATTPGNAAVVVDTSTNPSLTGNGTTASPLVVNIVDGGVYT